MRITLNSVSILQGSLYLFTFLLPLYAPVSMKIPAIICTVSVFVINWGAVSWKEIINQNKEYFIYFILFCLGLLYSENVTYGLKKIEQNIFVLLLPLLLSAALSNEKFQLDKNKILNCFVLGCFVASVICLSIAIYRGVVKNEHWSYFHQELTYYIRSHPIYFSYYVAFSVTFLAYSLIFKKNSLWRNITITLLILYFICFMVLLAGRLPTFSMFLVLMAMLYVGFRKSLKKGLITMSVLVLAGVLFFLLFQEKAMLKEKYLDLFSSQRKLSDTRYGGYIERVTLWKAALESNDNVLFGVGTGDSEDMLNDYYSRNALDEFHNYNPHNQYLSQYLALGVMGVLSLLYLLSRPIQFGIKTREHLIIFLFLPFFLYGVTESLFIRYQGIIFFLFFSIILTIRKSGSDNT